MRAAVSPDSRTGDEEDASEQGSGTEKRETPFASVLGALTQLGNTVAEAALAPLATCSVLSRSWEPLGGNLLLRPSSPPRAVLHFIGGAFVGAAPHIAYRSLLERLASRGYVIVASPYDISLDYLSTASTLADAWERIETDLALDYGALPVVGLGHSAGATYHAILSSLFADACPRAANVLVSFNNKKAEDAIPAYREVFAPAFRVAVEAERALPEGVREAFAAAPGRVEEALMAAPGVPKQVRENVLPTLREARRVLEQIAPMVREIGGAPPDGTVSSAADEEFTGGGANASAIDPAPEFYPPPAEVQAAVESLYSAGQTLLVRFASDGIDESSRAEEMLRMRGAGVDVDAPAVTLVELPGSHITPLAQDIPQHLPAEVDNGVQSAWAAADGGAQPAAPMLPVAAAFSAALQEVVDAAGGREMHKLEELIDEWVQAGVANGYL